MRMEVNALQSKHELKPIEKENKHPLFVFFVRFACVVILAYVAFSLISSEVKKANYQAEYNELTLKCSEVNEENALLSRYINGSDEEAEKYLQEYIEQNAREKLDLAYPDERVYYIVPGN